MRLLVVDVGSSAVKAGVWETAGRRAGPRSRVRLAVETRAQGVCVEVPGERLLVTVERAIRAALAAAGATRQTSGGGPALDALLFDTFSPGVVVVDTSRAAARNVLRVTAGCITHQDRRSYMEAADIEKQIGRARHLARAGNRPFPGGIGSTSLLWLRRQRPEVFAPGCKVGMAGSLLNYAWTGNWTIDPSQAAFLGLWDIRTGRWNAELCAAARVDPATLPEVRPAESEHGRVSAAAARRLGIAAGTPVYGGLVDTSAALLATPMHTGQLVHSAGSTDVLALITARPAAAPDLLTRPLGLGNPTVPGGGAWLAVSTIAASGSALDWCRHTLFSELSEAAFRRLVTRVCGRHDEGDSVRFAPYLAGDRTSLDPVTGAFAGLSLATGRDQMLAAVIAGLIEQSATRFARLNEVLPARKPVYTMGSNSALAAAMHQAWPRRMTFRPVAGDALGGLAQLLDR
jgi:xylulokinase